MINLPNYQIIQLIYESTNSFVYRGVRKGDNQPVILKMLKPDYPTPAELTRYQQEYEILNHFNFDGVIKAYGIEKYQNTRVLILEDFGGESLKQLRAKHPLTVPEFLPLAIQIANSLGNIHAAHLIHKDINPSNIVFNANTQQLKIIDFGIASRIPHEKPTLINPQHLEGTLAYISPEQTGRINRHVDYRTDFYSLGVTFYELLTGQVPFQSSDSLELVHCHLAKTPTSVHELNSEVPAIISELVMKLMAKNVDERYQSAFGVKTDLEKCLENLEGFENLQGLSFELAQHDFSGQFNLPQKLYGRDKEINTLLQAFERVTNSPQSQIELMLVAGYSGVGKTALVHEVHKPMTSRCGYFAAGKFDQYQRNIPYSAFTQAFNEFCHYLLTETAEQLAYWRQTILTAVGKNGQVLIDIIPALEWVIDKQPAVAVVESVAAQNRFNLVFQKFIRAICQPTHPLILFIDDWQWADSASLSLFTTLMTDTSLQYLFLIGAYRDNEVQATHPFMLKVAELQKAQVTVNTIYVPNLCHADVNAFISETLACEPAQTLPLTDLVYDKTQGNAFFTHQFLKSLYERQLLVFEWQTHQWHWEVDKIVALGMTNNVVELMAGKISQLATQTQKILTLAACIGNQFDLNTLSIISQQQPQDTLTHLWQAIEESLLLPLDENYKLLENQTEKAAATHFKFHHDRIQQAAYSLIVDTDKPAIHLQIGRLLLTNLSEESEEGIFEIVNQMNAGRKLLEELAEKLQLAGLNLDAGKRAKASAAYFPALKYFQIGIELLEKDSWQTQYYLTLSLYESATEAAYLSGDFVEMKRLLEIVLVSALTTLDKVKVYEVKINASIAQNQLLEAINTALTILKLLGIRFPKKPKKWHVLLSLLRTQFALAGKPIEGWCELPNMVDPYKLATMRILNRVFPAIYITIPTLMPLVIFKQVLLSITYGNAPESTVAYANYGMILCGVLGKIEAGFQFGQLAINVLEHFNTKQFQSNTLFVVNSFIKPWKLHLKESLEPSLKAYQSGLSNGDIEFAAYAAFSYCGASYFSCKELKLLKPEITSYSHVIKQLKQQLAFEANEIYRQVILNLTEASQEPCFLPYDEEQMLPDEKANVKSLIFYAYFNKFILCYWFEAYPQAMEHIVIAQRYLTSATGAFLIVIFHFYESLLQLALFSQSSKTEQKRLLKKVVANQKKMQKWAHHAPMNFLHKFYLVEAERARVLGKDGEAREYYDKAIALAQEHEYLNEEALAHELAGKFYLAKGFIQLAQLYLRNAYYTYQRWGATTKVKDLEVKYPQWFSTQSTSPQIMNPSSHTTTSNGLDFESVIKASQTLSGEIVLSKLLEKMMKIVIENAGAEKGFLLLPKNHQWFIEAEGFLEKAQINILPSISLENHLQIAITIIHYVVRTHQPVVLNNASVEGHFIHDPYIAKQQPQSILCAPLLNHGQLTGILYLENNLTKGAFTSERLEVLNLLSSQLAISIENAKLYSEVQENERTLKQFLEAVPVGVTVLDVQGNPYYVNQRAQQILGKGVVKEANIEKLTEIYQVYLAGTNQLYSPENLPTVRALLRGESTCVDDIEIHKGNQIIPLEHRGTPIFDEQGHITYAITAFQDITERKQAEADRIRLAQECEAKEVALRMNQEIEAKNQELAATLQQLKATQAQLIESEKMASLGGLVAGVAHEINTPLGIGVTAASTLADKTEKTVTAYENKQLKGSALKAYFETALRSSRLILNNLERAGNLVQNFKQVAVDQTHLDKRTFAVKKYIEDSLVNLTPYLKRTSHQIIVTGDDTLSIESYPGAFSQIITNLVMNSLNHAYQPGEAGHFQFDLRQESERLILTYSDDGCGIATDNLDKIFEPFFTTNRVQGGTGLGLHIVYNLVTQKLQGSIHCQSEVGIGTTFLIELPL